MSLPNPQDPDSPLYQFVDTQPASAFPATPDSSLSHFTTRQFTPENITNTWPIVVTITNHGFINGQALRFTKFISFPIALATGMDQLNNKLVYVQQATTNTFVLADASANLIDGRGFTPFISGGQITLTGSEVVGSDYLTVNPSNFPPPGIPVFPPT